MRIPLSLTLFIASQIVISAPIDWSKQPKELRPLWIKKAKQEVNSFLVNTYKKASSKIKMREFFDSQGNHYFRDQTGKLIADHIITPLRRPTSQRNIEFYYQRSHFLWDKGYQLGAVRILKEIEALTLVENERGYGLGLKFKKKAMQFSNKLRHKLGNRFEDLYNHVTIVHTEFIAKTAKNDFITTHIGDVYLRARFPSSWSIKYQQKLKNKYSTSFYMVADSRSDLLLKNLKWQKNFENNLNKYKIQDVYNYITSGKNLEKPTERFSFQITTIGDVWQRAQPTSLQALAFIWLKRRGIHCQKKECYTGNRNTVFPIKFINDVQWQKNKIGLNVDYEQQVIYRKQLMTVSVREVYYMTEEYSYLFILQARKKDFGPALVAFQGFLDKVKIDIPR